MTTNDFPFDQVVNKVITLLSREPNITVHQKFTCAGCGNRLTVDTPNTFYETGTCDKCDAVTNIKEQGCNFMLIKRMRRHGT